MLYKIYIIILTSLPTKTTYKNCISIHIIISELVKKQNKKFTNFYLLMSPIFIEKINQMVTMQIKQ